MDKVNRILGQWRRERPDLEVTPMGLIGRIKRLSRHLEREMDQTAAGHGLNLASFDVLATLRRAGKPYRMSPGELLASTMVTSGTMTHRVDLLVKAGHVKRVRNPEDGRSVLIALTPRGLRVIDEAVSDHVKTQARLTDGLSASEFRQLDQLLSIYLQTLERAPSTEGASD